MSAGWRQRIREWLCRQYGHRPTEDANATYCRRCLVLIGPKQKDTA